MFAGVADLASKKTTRRLNSEQQKALQTQPMYGHQREQLAFRLANTVALTGHRIGKRMLVDIRYTCCLGRVISCFLYFRLYLGENR